MAINFFFSCKTYQNFSIANGLLLRGCKSRRRKKFEEIRMLKAMKSSQFSDYSLYRKAV